LSGNLTGMKKGIMKKIKPLLKNWHFVRVLRLVLGIIFILNGLSEKYWFLLAVGGLFIYQAFMNSSCNIACQYPMTKDSINKSEKIEFEEIKHKPKTISRS
jgi:hypothetical protein